MRTCECTRYVYSAYFRAFWVLGFAEQLEDRPVTFVQFQIPRTSPRRATVQTQPGCSAEYQCRLPALVGMRKWAILCRHGAKQNRNKLDRNWRLLPDSVTCFKYLQGRSRAIPSYLVQDSSSCGSGHLVLKMVAFSSVFKPRKPRKLAVPGTMKGLVDGPTQCPSKQRGLLGFLVLPEADFSSTPWACTPTLLCKNWLPISMYLMYSL